MEKMYNQKKSIAWSSITLQAYLRIILCTYDFSTNVQTLSIMFDLNQSLMMQTILQSTHHAMQRKELRLLSVIGRIKFL